MLFSSYNVSRLELCNKKYNTGRGFRVAKEFVLNQVRVFYERVYADNDVSKFRFVMYSSSQHYSKFIANITSQNVSQVRIKKCKTRSFICKVNINFLCSSRLINATTTLGVFVFFLNESFHGFTNIRIWRVKTGYQIVKFRQLWSFLSKNLNFFSVKWHFGALMGRIVPKLQPLIDLPDSVAPVKSLLKSCVFCLEIGAQMPSKPTVL